MNCFVATSLRVLLVASHLHQSSACTPQEPYVHQKVRPNVQHAGDLDATPLCTLTMFKILASMILIRFYGRPTKAHSGGNPIRAIAPASAG